MALPKIILLACGSYSPPTNMHFRMFEIARDYFTQMGTHQVLGGIVSPVHDSYGKQALIASKHRAAMVKLALQSSEWVRLSDWEMQQEQWTRTRLTLQYHQNYINSYLNDINGTVNDIIPGWLPESIKNSTGNIQIKLLCGADLLESFATPGLWDPEDIEAIVGQHGIVVVTRNGANPEQFIFNSDILTKYRRNIHIVTNWVSNEISSTVVRKLLRRGQSVKYLIDDYVIEYIKKNGLFGINDSKYILTPNQNEVIFLEPPSSAKNKNYITNLKNDNSDDDFEDMDETDYASSNNFLIRPKVFCCGDGISVKQLLGGRSNESRNGNNTGGVPGQVVQIITDSNGMHSTTLDNELKVGDKNSTKSCESTPNKVKNIKNNVENEEERDKVTKLKDNHNEFDDEIACKATISDDDGVEPFRTKMKRSGTMKSSLPTTSSRDNDIIKFVFTDHGIRVISDKEYVV